eukprot:7391847-Prymnesium_polylepis.8
MGKARTGLNKRREMKSRMAVGRTASNVLPKCLIMSPAKTRCCGMEQCISSDRITGSAVVTKAASPHALATSSNETMVQNV